MIDNKLSFDQKLKLKKKGGDRKIVNGISNKPQFIDCRRASSQHGRGFQKKIKNIYIPDNRPHLAGHPARVKVFFFD